MLIDKKPLCSKSVTNFEESFPGAIVNESLLQLWPEMPGPGVTPPTMEPEPQSEVAPSQHHFSNEYFAISCATLQYLVVESIMNVVHWIFISEKGRLIQKNTKLKTRITKYLGLILNEKLALKVYSFRSLNICLIFVAPLPSILIQKLLRLNFDIFTVMKREINSIHNDFYYIGALTILKKQ